jgi:Fe-S-cluster-containing dehydrogenase component/formate-dependent nitrite reductase membrane component NrfD
VQLGFVLDKTRCIGCHACTVACKSENDVPVGDFRTWVKYTEEGQWPENKRSFTVLRCNQCTDAPCITICPVSALEKAENGIVDIDPAVCIGCKACLQGCPYDAIFLNEEKGIAQKCHFCAHRAEVGLAPACAVVCPTEAIVPGDMHDPSSRASALVAEHGSTVRKPEAGTNPNVHYVEASPAGIDPLQTSAAGGLLWAQQLPGERLDAILFDSMEEKAAASTTYDVQRSAPWGAPISGYLFFKSLSAGVLLAGAMFLPPFKALADVPFAAPLLVPGLALLFLTVTLGLLVADLKRPERFLSILLRPNWSSWLAKGSFALLFYSLVLVAWIGFGIAGVRTGMGLFVVTAALAILSAVYTAWLFAQAKGRVLWMKKGFDLHLLFQAVVAGSALLLVIQALAPGLLGSSDIRLDTILMGSLMGHLALILFEPWLAPTGRAKEYHVHARLLTKGPYAKAHWLGGVALGIVAPIALIAFVPAAPALVLAGVAALVGLAIHEHAFVRAGQALPIS